MRTSRLRAGQMSAHERAIRRAERARPNGISNNLGGASFFTQGKGDAAPNPEETAAAVRFSRGLDGPELAGHQAHAWGPRFGELLPGIPANTDGVVYTVNGEPVPSD